MSAAAARVAVISGAASGLGRALALALARRGHHITGVDVNAAGLAATLADCEAAGVETLAWVRDVTEPAGWGELADAVWARWGRCDLLVNNAGVVAAGAVGDIPLSDWRWAVGVMLDAPFHACHHFAPRLRAQGHGHIVNIASAAGFASLPFMGPYNVAKSGLITLSDTLRAELRDAGVGVTAVCPSFFRSNLHKAIRSPSQRSRAIATRLLTGAPTSAETMAGQVLAAVDAGSPFLVPRADAKLVWWLRRALPGPTTRLMGLLGRLDPNT